MDNGTSITVYTDGVFGLGLDSDNIAQSPISMLKEENLIENRIFAFYLGKGSRLLLGGKYYSTKYSWMYNVYYRKYISSVLQWFDMISLQHYTIDFDVIKFLGMNQVIDVDKGVVIDSGTSFIIIPELLSNTVDELLKSMPGAVYNTTVNLWQIENAQENCQHWDSLEIALSHDQSQSVTLTIEPEYYVFKYDEKYFVGMVSIKNDNLWTLGNIFLKKYFVVFNIENQQIGIAENSNAEGFTPMCKKQN